MDASAAAKAAEVLRFSIKAIESRSDSLESWLYFWVLLVVVGVAIEAILGILEYREGLEEFHRGTIRSPERPHRLKFGFELFAAALVVIGVAGELLIDLRVGKLQTELRAKNEALGRVLEGVATDALKEAAASAREATQQLARAKEHLSPWEFDDLAQSRIIESLKPFAGALIEVRADSHPYATELADKLLNVLAGDGKAGWMIRWPSGRAHLRPTQGFGPSAIISASGISVGFETDQSPVQAKVDFDRAAKALVDGLIAVGIPAKTGRQGPKK
jgi:hypothetical protein